MVLAFVYGTLKTGMPNHHILKNKSNGAATLVCSGHTAQKFPLVVATPFYIPFMLDKEGYGEFLEGEIYDVDEEMMNFLDKFEANKQLYLRTPIKVIPCEDNIPYIIKDGCLTCGAYILNNYKETLLDLPCLKSYREPSSYVPPTAREKKLEDMLAMVKNFS